MSDVEADPTSGNSPSGENRPSADGEAATGRVVTPLSERRAWLTVAKKDVSDAVRSWQMYGLLLGFAALLPIVGTLPALSLIMRGGGQQSLPARMGFDPLTDLVVQFVPLIVLIVGQMPIVRDRERGSLRVMLSFPVTRLDVLLGTFFGRLAVVGGTFLAGLLVTGVGMYAVYDSMNVRTYVWFSVGVLAFVLPFVGLAVGISALSRERGTAFGISVATYLLVTFLWQPILLLINALTGVVTTQVRAPDVAPGWYVLLWRAQPMKAWLVVRSDWLGPRMPTVDFRSPTTLTTAGPEPFYLDTWAMGLVLVSWGLLPLAVGYWRFRTADVG